MGDAPKAPVSPGACCPEQGLCQMERRDTGHCSVGLARIKPREEVRGAVTLREGLTFLPSSSMQVRRRTVMKMTKLREPQANGQLRMTR